MDSNKSHHQASVLQVSDNAKKATIASFPAATDEYRYLRKRASILCAVFNAQPVDISQEERCRAWNAIVDPSNKKNATECPLIKGPIYIDYGVNFYVHPTSFINRDCYIADSPEIDIRIGANTLISVGVRLLGVTHPVDWRERQGRKGPSLAGDVTIGNDCFIGCGAIVLPGVTIGDGCVIGAGSVVTKSIPSYHVAIGNPARVVRKVAPDVADAPGLMYVDDGDRILASVQNSSEHKRSFQPISLRNGDRIHEEDQLSQKTSSIRGGMPDEGGKLSKVALNLVMIFLPLGAGYVLGWRSS